MPSEFISCRTSRCGTAYRERHFEYTKMSVTTIKLEHGAGRRLSTTVLLCSWILGGIVDPLVQASIPLPLAADVTMVNQWPACIKDQGIVLRFRSNGTWCIPQTIRVLICEAVTETLVMTTGATRNFVADDRM